MKLFFYFTVITFTTMFAQSEISHILKVYPDWKTNFSKSIIKFDELIAGGPPKDGIPAIQNQNSKAMKKQQNG